jgi:hypothetical protein
MSMHSLPKISTEFSGTNADYTISTMGDTTHVMVNEFCYHINQIKTPELKSACETLLQASRILGQTI